MEERRENPWAVYGWFLGSWGVGKITSESESSVKIQYIEGQQYPSECWDSKWVKRFDSPIKAMAYFLRYQRVTEKPYTKKEIVKLFLQNFPSEIKNIESRLDLKNKYNIFN